MEILQGLSPEEWSIKATYRSPRKVQQSIPHEE
jgi:hypothetical protein